MSDTPIATTKDRPGSYDAIETAKPGEPLFPIQGGDPLGPATVLHWADLARTAARAEPEGKAATRLFRKASDAEEVAWQMVAYQRGEIAQEGRRAQYNDALIADDTDHERAVREARIKGAGLLNNVVAQATDAADSLEKLMSCLPEVAELREAIARIKAAALTIEPRRGQERS